MGFERYITMLIDITYYRKKQRNTYAYFLYFPRLSSLFPNWFWLRLKRGEKGMNPSCNPLNNTYNLKSSMSHKIHHLKRRKGMNLSCNNLLDIGGHLYNPHVEAIHSYDASTLGVLLLYFSLF